MLTSLIKDTKCITFRWFPSGWLTWISAQSQRWAPNLEWTVLHWLSPNQLKMIGNWKISNYILDLERPRLIIFIPSNVSNFWSSFWGSVPTIKGSQGSLVSLAIKNRYFLQSRVALRSLELTSRISIWI